jgi:Protein of unknown function (DUF2851)
VSESFLHYLWQFQYFDKKELKTTAGDDLIIIKPGMPNTDAGPDFPQAKIKIDGMDWAGSVEIHVKSSEWMEHGHHLDQAYENVVLHVVWAEDKPIYRADGTRIPALALSGRVNERLINEYQKLISNSSVIPCEHSFSKIDSLTKLSMVDKALMKRLEDKANQVGMLLNQNNGDWEETTYQLLAANFGFKVNKEPFLQLAKALTYKIIQKHRDQPVQVEALLFGQAGFLVAKTKDEYITKLFNEYQFFSKKYSLQSSEMNVAQWKFLRLRPSNFPTLRIAQFAALLQSRKSIFSHLIEIEGYKALQQFFRITPSSYWQTHYRFGKKAEGAVPDFGEASADMVIINSVVPLLVAYGKAKDDWTLVDKAVNILQHIASEKNKIVTLWKDLGYTSKNAFDSQGLIELYQNFCQSRQCLNCNIGSAILKPGSSAS